MENICKYNPKRLFKVFEEKVNITNDLYNFFVNCRITTILIVYTHILIIDFRHKTE